MTTRDIKTAALQPGLNEFKLHLRITSNDQDALLMPYLKAAALAAEHHIGRCLEESSFTYEDRFTSSISLPHVDPRYFPLIGVPQVTVDGEPTTDFQVLGNTLVFDEAVQGAEVKVVYEAGGIVVEDDIKVAILLIASKFFNNPVDSVETLPSVATNLLGQYRRWGLRDGEQD